MKIKLINKTGINNKNYGLQYALIKCIEYSTIFESGIKDSYKTQYNYNYKNNGNTWSRTAVYFRRTKSGNWIAE